MKNSTMILLIGVMTINILSSQSKVEISEIEERNIDGQTLIFLENKK